LPDSANVLPKFSTAPGGIAYASDCANGEFRQLSRFKRKGIRRLAPTPLEIAWDWSLRISQNLLLRIPTKAFLPVPKLFDRFELRWFFQNSATT
jgi:hypothetical protein